MKTETSTNNGNPPDDKANVSGSLHLLSEMYEELRLKEKEGFETWQDRDINSNHQNAILCVRRLIQKRAAQ